MLYMYTRLLLYTVYSVHNLLCCLDPITLPDSLSIYVLFAGNLLPIIM